MLLSRSLRFSAVAGLLLVAIAGCSSSGSSSDDTAQTLTNNPGVPPLVHTHWILSASTDLGVPMTGVAVSAGFASGRITGTSGCNAYNAPYQANAPKLTIGPDIASTQVSCSPVPTAVEHAYLALLPKVTSYTIKGLRLSLRDAAGTTVLGYTASTGSDEVAGKWTVTTYYTGTAVQSVINGSTLTADFADGRVSGESGCNSYRGPYQLTPGAAITMGPFTSTRVACANPELQAQEQHFLDALGLATKYQVTGDSLGLLRSDGGVAATFERS